MYAKPIFLPTQRLEDLEDRRFVWHVHACHFGVGRLLQASFPNPDSDPFFFLRKKVRFLKMDNVLKLNFQAFDLETWPISSAKNSKAQGMVLKGLKSKTLFRGSMSPELPH